MSDHDQKTRILVETSDPPPQPLGEQEGYSIIQADLSGVRVDSEDQPLPPDWTAFEVTASNYEEFLKTKFQPRFREAVKDHLSGKADSQLAVDHTFTTTTPHWRRQLLEGVPEVAAVMALIDQLQQFKRYLSQQVPVRNRLENMMALAIEAPSTNGKAN